MARRSSHWKGVERTIATLLGGIRVPITGRIRGSAPDIAHDYLSIEVKHRAKGGVPALLKTAMDQAVASKEGRQIPVAVLHTRQQKYEDSLVCLPLRDFKRMLEVWVAVDQETGLDQLDTMLNDYGERADGEQENGRKG